MIEDDEVRYWERITGFISENDIDAKWILKSNVNDKSHGSLRIVSHPDLPAGHLRAYASFVTGRRPKTQQEMLSDKENYLLEDGDLEIYSIDEHITTTDHVYEDTLQNLQKDFGVEIF